MKKNTLTHKNSKSMNFLIRSGSHGGGDIDKLRQPQHKAAAQPAVKTDAPNLIFRYKMSNPDSFRHPDDLTNRPQLYEHSSSQAYKKNTGDSVILHEKKASIRKLT